MPREENPPLFKFREPFFVSTFLPFEKESHYVHEIDTLGIKPHAETRVPAMTTKKCRKRQCLRVSVNVFGLKTAKTLVLSEKLRSLQKRRSTSYGRPVKAQCCLCVVPFPDHCSTSAKHLR